ncbi:MAG: hypothetical protein KGH52_04330, partial [Candidatus Micrarchaeota archaeon]|nr:hypothetical protein [Candidatus Micrarchaeota archaeon]
AMDTLFVAVIAVFTLREVFSLPIYVGIGMLLLGITLLGMRKIGKPRINKAVAIMLFASFLLGSSTVIVKYLLGFGNYLSILADVLLGYVFVLVPLLYLNFHKVRRLVETNRKGVAVLVTKETIAMFANILFIFAASIGPIALVNALSSVQPLFVLVFAVGLSVFYPKILREEIRESSVLLKLAAIVVIIIGSYLISV